MHPSQSVRCCTSLATALRWSALLGFAQALTAAWWLAPASAHAGNLQTALFGTAGGSNSNEFVSVDPRNGDVRLLQSFPNLPATPYVSALDAANDRFFFPVNDELYVLDTQTGAVLGHPALSEPTLYSLEFDGDSGMLYGHGYISGANAFVSVDPSTGGVTSLQTFPGLFGTSSATAFDAVNDRFYFPLAGDLYTLDARTGNVLAHPRLAEEFIYSLEFDPNSGQLLGHGYIAGANAFVSVDPVTGDVTTLQSFPGLFGTNYTGTLDAVNERFYFPLADDLYVLNSRTGSVLAHPRLSYPYVYALRAEAVPEPEALALLAVAAATVFTARRG